MEKVIKKIDTGKGKDTNVVNEKVNSAFKKWEQIKKNPLPLYSSNNKTIMKDCAECKNKTNYYGTERQ